MDLRRIDLNLLVTLDVLLSERNVSLAAERLGMSQPAVSARLNRLREMFSDRLFSASRRGLVPTRRALELRQPLARVLADLDSLIEGGAFNPAEVKRVFRLVASDAVHASVCAPFAASIQSEFAGIDFAFLAAAAGSVERRLNAGELDLALVSPSLLPQSAKRQVLYEERFLSVMRQGHPLAGRKLDAETFCNYEHILVSTEGGGFRGTVDTVLEQAGFQRKVRISVPNFLVVPELLANSDMIATLPERVALLWKDRLHAAKPPVEIPAFPIFMAWSARAGADEGLSWLRKRLATHVVSGMDGRIDAAIV